MCRTAEILHSSSQSAPPVNAQAEREEASLYDDDVTAQLDTDDVGQATPINDNDDLLALMRLCLALRGWAG